MAATARELAPLQRRLQLLGQEVRCDFLITGVGKAAAACEVGMRLAGATFDLHIQIGCAGAYPSSGLAVGDVVLGTEETLADEGVETPSGFLDMKALGLPAAKGGSRDPCSNRVPLAAASSAAWKEVLTLAGRRYRVRRGRLATVSACSGTDERAACIEARWRPLAESMEGAAAALAVSRNRARLHEVRGISNLTGDRYRHGWDLESACEHAADVAAVLITVEARRRAGVRRGGRPR